MKNIQVIPAVPGTYIVWYNHCHDSTQVEPVLFWLSSGEDDEEKPYVKPMVMCEHSGFAYEFDLPQQEYPEGDPRFECESSVIAFIIPGWGRISYAKQNEIYGYHTAQAKGYVADLAPE